MMRVSDLAIVRGGVPLLAGLSFAVEPGSALILRGPNGIGKTTLLRTLAGLQPPAAGQIEVPEDSVAYASHADGIKGQLSVVENLNFWARVYGMADVTDAVLERFALQDLRARAAATLSAGQKRRLGLARLAVIGRKILLLDEPTVSLDTASVGRFASFLQDHLDAGGSAVIATHIDLGFTATVLELAPYKLDAPALTASDFDEAFL
ncbi:MAG: heme ABC exporter ATP-binding protein CcmA [Oceanicola sp.]|jgi:heme exporter protein A|nr:heme ABC exporter ATP-binding protein CcmA [Oceanicola sp.]